MILRTLASSILILTLFSSCSDDEVDPSVLTLLTDNDRKSWRLVKSLKNGEIDNISCGRDDIWTFQLYDESQNGQPAFQIEDNYISCDNSYIQKGIWRLNNKKNRIITTNSVLGSTSRGANTNLVYDIIKLSETELVLNYFNEEGLYGLNLVNLEYHFIAY